MSTTIPGLDPVTSLLDTDVVMITHSNGTTEKMTGANLKSAINNIFINKYRKYVDLNKNVPVTISVANQPFMTCELVTLSRDDVDYLGIGILYWNYNISPAIYWLKAPGNKVGFTINTVGTKQISVSITINQTVRMSFLNLSGIEPITISS